jgi:hypothetical protein
MYYWENNGRSGAAAMRVTADVAAGASQATECNIWRSIFYLLESFLGIPTGGTLLCVLVASGSTTDLISKTVNTPHGGEVDTALGIGNKKGSSLNYGNGR